jgi:hypothetical protein
VQAQVYGGHADVAAGGVHYAVVVGEGAGVGESVDVGMVGWWFGLEETGLMGLTRGRRRRRCDLLAGL